MEEKSWSQCIKNKQDKNFKNQNTTVCHITAERIVTPCTVCSKFESFAAFIDVV